MSNAQICKLLSDEINGVIIGKEEVVRNVLISFIAGGHVLLEDIPGVGKTTLALAFSKGMGLTQKRMQFTPDIMPSDLTGFSVFNKETNDFEYREGVLSCNLFLADEINRTSPKTQSSLLEAMEEGKVTVDGVTRKLENPFLVIATQNPFGSVGTSLLPESQMDRFMMRISMGYPDANSEILMLKNKEGEKNPVSNMKNIMSQSDFLNIQKEAQDIFIHDGIYEYIIKLITATRNNPYIEQGVSPRGSVALTKAARACAFINGRDYVIPEDIKEVFAPVINHRIILKSSARASRIGEEDIIRDILSNTGINKVKNYD
jgi:MoxR-like ATPase